MIRSVQNGKLLPKQKDTKATHTATHSHSQSRTLCCLGRSRRCQTRYMPDSDQDVTTFTSEWFERERERRVRHDSKLKLLITVRNPNSTDIRKSSISLNVHSAPILEHKSNYHSYEQRRSPHILGMWWNRSPSHESPHLLDIWAFDYILNSAVSTDGSA